MRTQLFNDKCALSRTRNMMPWQTYIPD